MATDDHSSGHRVGTEMGETQYDPIYRDSEGVAYSHPVYPEPANVYVERAIGQVQRADPEDIQQVAASQLALSNSYYENVLAQARRSFGAAIVSAGVGLAFFIAAVLVLILNHDVSAGTVSAVSGGIVEVIAGLNFWLYGRTAVQLNSFHVRLEQTQKYLIANSIATKLDGTARETALLNLIGQIADYRNFGDVSER